MMRLRPLPSAIAAMLLLLGIKAASLVHLFDVARPAQASPHASTPEPRAPARTPAKEEQPKPSAAPVAGPPALPVEPPISEAERAALQDLRARRAEIEARAARLDEREALVATVERRLSERVQQLTALQTKLEQLDKDRQERQEANWRGLVRTYENMRPRDAASIFNDIDNAVLIPVLDRMKDSKAAPILAAMTPERARSATSLLAQARTQATAAPALAGPEQGAKK